jgi:purine-binding chemotaxis protein CheW
MKDRPKTKERLIGESGKMRQGVAKETGRKRVGKTVRKAEEYTESISEFNKAVDKTDGSIGLNRRSSHMDVSDMNRFNHLVLFTLDEQRYALYLHAVTRVVRTVEITRLPKVPEIIRGMVNVQGQVIPVVDIRKRFRLPEREPELSDQLIIANTASRSVALVVEAVEGVIEHPGQEMIPPEKILPGMEYIKGVIKLEDGLVLIHDVDKFLSLKEDKELDAALNKKK